MTKILAIEDEPAILSYLLMILKVSGFDSIGASDGLIGLDLAQKELPDLILCDVIMPGLGGYEVLNTLRQNPETALIPFIFLTGNSDRAAQREGMNLGADDYLTKPFTRAELLDAIASRLAKYSDVNKQFQIKMNDLRLSFARTLPHEFFTPLSTIMMASEYLLENQAESEERVLVTKIHGAAQRLQRLIQNFLLYAELELAAQDQLKLQAWQSSRTHTARTILSNVAHSRARQVGREADLVLDLQTGIARISEERFKKLAEELIDNAFKYSKVGTPVHITTVCDTNSFVFSVTDYGRGMTAEQIANLGAYTQFERKVYEQQGSGLGLSIARRLVELHNGQFIINSTPGTSTIINCILPVG